MFKFGFGDPTAAKHADAKPEAAADGDGERAASGSGGVDQEPAVEVLASEVSGLAALAAVGAEPAVAAAAAECGRQWRQ